MRGTQTQNEQLTFDGMNSTGRNAGRSARRPDCADRDWVGIGVGGHDQLVVAGESPTDSGNEIVLGMVVWTRLRSKRKIDGIDLIYILSHGNS